MDRNEIDFYLHNILKKQLQKFKISNYVFYAVLDNIKNQLSSIIKNWNNHNLINTIFLTVIEEGHFTNQLQMKT